MDTTPRRMLLLIALVALAHAAFFAIYQRPDWNVEWDDQVGYQRLGHVLATTGTFTRYPGVQPFVPGVQGSRVASSRSGCRRVYGARGGCSNGRRPRPLSDVVSNPAARWNRAARRLAV